MTRGRVQTRKVKKNVPSNQDVASFVVVLRPMQFLKISHYLNIVTILYNHGFGRKTIVSEMK